MEPNSAETVLKDRSFNRSFHANESEVLYGRLSVGGQHLHFTKRIRELERELDSCKHAQHKIIAERDLSVARLQLKIQEQDLFINTLSRELNSFGEGSSLLDKINELLRKLEESEDEQRRLKKKLAYFDAMISEGLIPTADKLKEDQLMKKRQVELENELKSKEDDLLLMEKRLNELKEIRNELVDYTVTLEDKIKKFEGDKNDFSEGIKEKNHFIKKLETQMYSMEQTSKDEQDFFFQQLNRKTSAMQNEIKDLESKLKDQAQAKDERVEALNQQMQEVVYKFEQLKKDNAALKDRNDHLSDINNNFETKVLEVTDTLSAKFRKTEEELREKIRSLAREKAALEQMLSEAAMDGRFSVVGGISFEDEMRNLEDYRPSWVNTNSNVEELTSKIAQYKLDLIEKDRIIQTQQQEIEEYKQIMLEDDTESPYNFKESEEHQKQKDLKIQDLLDIIVTYTQQENDDMYNSLAEDNLQKEQALAELQQKMLETFQDDQVESLHQMNRIQFELVINIQKNTEEIIQDLKSKNQDLSTELTTLRQVYNQDTERLSVRIDDMNYQNKQLENKLEILMDTEENRRTLRSSRIDDELTKMSVYRNSIINVKQVLNEEISTRYEEIKEECVRYIQVSKDSIITRLKLQNEELEKDLAKHKEMYNEVQDDLISKYKESDELVQTLQNVRSRLKIVEMDNQRYKLNRVDSKILKLQLENETLRGEYEKMKTDLLLSKEKWAQELNNLYEEIQQNERTARNSKLETTKLVEERDVFKTFIEKKLSKKKNSASKSWFDFFKS